MIIEVRIDAGVDVVLVRVDADGEPPLVLGRLEHAEPGGARGRVDDVGAAVELAPRQLAARASGSFHAAGVVPVMFWKTSIFGLTYLAPSS